MKKLFALLFALMLAFSSFALVSCEQVESGEKTPLSFYAPDGAPALSIAKFINDKEDFDTGVEINYNVVSSSVIGPTMAKGDADLMVIPVNAASKLYKANASDPYVMTAVVTHGNLYIASTEENLTLEGLKGKVIGVIGQGLVPDLTLRAVLKDNDLLDDVVEGDTATDGKITIRYFAQAPDMLPLLKQGKLTVGLLPEPALTNLTTKVAPDKTWNILDLQELYDAETKAYPQAVLMVKKSVYNKFKTQIVALGDYFASNLTWIKENTEQAVTAVNSVLPDGVTPSLNANAINAQVIDNCKIYYQSSSDAKQQVIEYLNKIIAVSSDAAKAVSDDFFA
ncbi:MAG: hypothetical protein IJW64_02295 [Clostridia bacterium]|nr:hypothetical protein [Clostridia bacterium]